MADKKAFIARANKDVFPIRMLITGKFPNNIVVSARCFGASPFAKSQRRTRDNDNPDIR
jgi:hypothetical protein